MTEIEKVLKVADDSNKIGIFLEWLEDNGYYICEWNSKETEYFPTFESINKLLAAYYGVDLMKLDEEKKEYLRQLRNAV